MNRIKPLLVTAFLSLGLAGISPYTLAAERVDESMQLLEGVWAGERSFGYSIEGPLVLTLEGKTWRADLAGFHTAVSARGTRLSFELPSGLGSFRGHLETGSGWIQGFWIQKGVTSAFGQRFATPVRLVQQGPGLWKGELDPLADKARLFVVIEPSEGGGWKAFIRNPEVNFGRFFSIEKVEREGDRISFQGHFFWEKDAEAHEVLSGWLHTETETLSLFAEGLGGNYDLTRLAENSISDFPPRPPGMTHSKTGAPPRLDDGWPVASLEAVGLAPEPIDALIDKIASAPIETIDSPYVEAMLVARHGRLVVEEYFHGHRRDRPHDVRSASKSHTATLVAAALREESLSLGTQVYHVLADEKATEGLDPRASRMTLEHLITMTSGLACDDWDEASPGGEDRMQNQEDEPDWHRYLLEQPMAFEPGEHPAYCSGGMSLAGAVVAEKTGSTLTEAFDRLLARPLQMGTYHVNLMPNGKAYAGGGLRLTARDFLKLGQLLLDDGVWNGREILEKGRSEWLITRRHDLGSERLGAYGAGWWLLDYEVDGRRFEAFYAGGNGGNYVIGIPALDLVVAFQASNFNQSVQHDSKLEWVPQYLIRSALNGSATRSEP